MRLPLAATTLSLLLLAGCGGAKSDSDFPSADQNEPSASTGPSDTTGDGAVPRVDPASAPGVAFGYRYRFGLGADQIASVQQGHARACEELGPDKCRVTGMDFRRNDDDVDASLSLAIDPGVAHRFGEQALANVREAEGKLVDSAVTGRQVRAASRTGEASVEQLEQQLAELQRQIGRTQDPVLLRSLDTRAANLRERIQIRRNADTADRETTTFTTLDLSYTSSAFATGNPDFGSAASGAWGQVKWIAYALFSLLMLLGPWALVGGLIWFAASRLRRGRREIESA